jgi:hypothetical protein
MLPPYFVPPAITLVRWPDRDANQILDNFVNGGHYTGHRAPRGMDPLYVSWWIRQRIQPDCSPLTMSKVRDLLRFYERGDVLDHLARMLTKTETDDRAFRRSAYILQCIGDVGTLEPIRFAAGYFAEFLLPLPFAITLFPLVLETAEGLVPAIDMGNVSHRLQTALAAAQQVPDIRGPEGLHYRKYSDYNRNDLPASIRVVEGKQRLMATDPDQRLQELLVTYLGEGELSTPSMEIWAGRMIRAHAMKSEEAKNAVLAAFTQVMQGAIRSTMPKPKKEFLVHRCGQAILYLGGKLGFSEAEFFEGIASGPENFLWDDPGAPSVPIE